MLTKIVYILFIPVKAYWARIFLLIALAFFCWLQLKIALDYYPVSDDNSFLLLKSQVLDVIHWKIAFYVHVVTSIFVLLAGFTQFSASLLKEYPKLHRILGFAYVINILFITGPAGLIMSYYANGGIYSRIAFIILSVLWIYFTAMAWYEVVKKRFVSHKYYMVRSFALTLSAITLRIWKYLFIHSGIHIPPMDIYRIVAWLGWGLNLVVAEWMIYRWRKEKMSSKATMQ